MDLQRINELGFEKMSVWHLTVLVVSFSYWWNIFITAQCYIVFILSTSSFAFNLHIPNITIILYAADIFYLLDTIFLFAYVRDKRMNKLKIAKRRSLIFIIVDIISLIPLELMQTFFYISEVENMLVFGILSQNRVLRIYRVFLLEMAYILTIRTHGKYILYTFFSVFSKSLIVGHLLTCVWYNVKKNMSCDPDRFNCYLWYEINMLQVVMHNWSGSRKMFKEPAEEIIVTLAMLLGFFLIYTYTLPHMFYFTLQLCYNDSVYYSKRERLEKFLENMNLKGSLGLKIEHYFRYVWLEGDADEEMNLMLSNIPVAEHKEICTDIYWEAFRHSFLFRESSRSFKRTLSLVMSTEYHHDGEVIYYKGQEKRKMMYLAQGTLQIMAQENENSPLLSFSSGTVFGELSLFLFTQSHTILKCKGFCELQILTYRGVSSAMGEYPKDRKLIFQKINQRIQMARQAQWRKKFQEDQKLQLLFADSSVFEVEDCVKWLKTQWMRVWEGHKRHLEVIKAKEEGTRLSGWRVSLRPAFKIEFISNYLDLIVLSHFLEERNDMVCLRTQFPWSIDPSTQFLSVWRKIILVTSLIPAFAYPACTAWCTTFPRIVYIMSFIVTLIYIIDVGLKLMTAVQTKHKTITRFSQVLQYNLRQPTFYFDIIAAIPFQLYLCTMMNPHTTKPYVIGFFLHPAIFKSYIFFAFKVPLGNNIVWLTLLKNVLIYCFLLYWLSEMIQLYSVINIFNLKSEWIDRYLKKKKYKNFLKDYFISLFKACVTAISTPSTSIYSDDNFDLVFVCIAKYAFFVFSCYFMGDLYCSLIIKGFSLESFRALSKRIRDFLVVKKVPEQIALRFLRGTEFQWRYNHAEHLSNENTILKSMPLNLRREVFLETIYKTIQSCTLFQNESMDYTMEVLDTSDFVAVPRGMVLVTYGQISHLLMVLIRGYCQLNSHLVEDVTANLGRAVVIGPGTAFPVLSSFCNVPSPVSVITVTDCELIMIHLNDLASLMIKYNFFKDLVQTLKEENLCEKLVATRPALIKMSTTKGDADFFIKASKKKSYWMKLIFACFSTGDPEERLFFFKNWEFFHSMYLLLDCFLWPCCFGLFLFYQHIILPILVTLRIIDVLHMIFHVFMPYYNKDGLIITQPGHTLTNYLKTSFILDLTRFIPVFPVYYYCFAETYKKPNTYFVGVDYLQHLLGLVCVMGCIKYVCKRFLSQNYTEIVKMSLGSLLVIHMHANYMMFLFTNWFYGGPRKIVGFELVSYCQSIIVPLRNNSLSDVYVVMNYWIMATITTNKCNIMSMASLQLYLSYVQSFIGTLSSYLIIVILSTSSKFLNVGETRFREEFSSLMKYLKHEEAGEKLVEHISAFFEYEWVKMQGESFTDLMRGLPMFLKEELWYPLYRSTFVQNGIFENADEGFFKILAAHVSTVFFTRGSVVIFQNEVQSYIYFVHRGKCFAYDWFMILDCGSMIGDVRQTGLMHNKVYALTHVEMLKISAESFFTILNNFDILEANFLYSVRKVESFIKSDVYRDYHPLRPVDSGDAVNAFDLKTKEIGFEDESHFEDPGNTKIQIFNAYKYKPKEKRIWVIYPYSWKMKMYLKLGFINVVLTLFCVPVFVASGSVSKQAFTVFGILDFTYLIFVITNFRLGLVDVQKGDVTTNFKYIAKNYVKKGFILDLISLIPFELLPLAAAKGRMDANTDAVAILRVVRYIRVYNFYKNRINDLRMLKSAVYKRCILTFIFFLWTLIVTTAIFMKITVEPTIKEANDPFTYSWKQLRAVLMALKYEVDFFTSSNVPTVIPKSSVEMLHFSATVFIMVFIKGKVLSSVLAVIHSKNLTTSHYKAQVSKLESFLVKKDTSPILIKGMIDYKMNLFQYSRSENMSFLKRAPMSLQIPVMRNLFGIHIAHFPLFQGLDKNFLDQLTARMKREVYFPGQKIVEQGDVDHRFYFIHSGEVYIINQTKERAYVEYVVGKLGAGEYFGESQGLWFVKPHSYTYRGRTFVEIISLHMEDWEDLRRAFPMKTQAIFEKASALQYI